MAHQPERISVWLLKKGDRGVAAMRTWKKRFFQSFGRNEDVEICYFKSAEGEKQGSIELRSVREIRLVEDGGIEPELHVVTASGRVYMLRASKNEDEDELTRVWALWQQWLSYVRSFVPASSSLSSAPVTDAGTPKSPRPTIPSLTIRPTDDKGGGGAGRESPPPAPATKKESPRKERKDTLSPRRLLSDAKARAFGGGGRKKTGESEEEESGGGAGARLKYSLLQSMQPHIALHFVLSKDELVGYSDDTLSEAVERIELARVVRVVGDREDGRRFQLLMGDGETRYLEAEEAGAATWWTKSVRAMLPEEEEEELDEPELGMCELHLDVAEEVDVRAADSKPPLPPRPPHNHRGNREPPKEQPPPLSLPSASVLVCPVCSSVNVSEAERCVECGSSDGFARPSSAIAEALGSPHVMRPFRMDVSAESSPVAAPKRRPLPPPPPPL